MQSKTVSKYSISPFIFVFNIIILLLSIFMLSQTNNNLYVIFIIFVSNLLFVLPNLLIFKGQKIFLSNRKIYITNKVFKSKITLDLISDLQYFKQNKTFFGKIFNFGTVSFVDMNKNIYKINFIESPDKLEDEIVNNTNNYFKSLNLDLSINKNNYIEEEQQDNKEKENNESNN